jgi:type I restriction enzyme S subunit
MENIEPTLPKGWVSTKVGDISNIIHYGYTASSTDEPVGPRILRITDIQNNSVNWNTVPYCKIESGEEQKYLLREGDLLFARTGATVGKSFLIKGEIPFAVFASYLIRIILSRYIKKEFIYNFFQSNEYWLQIKKGQLGIGQPNVNSQTLSKIFLPLPPLPEQQRIVAKIEELFTKLDAGIEALKKIKGQLKRFRQAVLKYAFEGKLTEGWRKVHKDELEPSSVLLERIKEERNLSACGPAYRPAGAGRHAQAGKQAKSKGERPFAPTVDVSDLPELPEAWVWTRLQETSEIILGQSPPSSTYNKTGNGLPFYQGKLEFGDLYPTPQKYCSVPKKIAEKGDVLISVRAPVGPTNICPEKSCIGRGLAAIRALGGIGTPFMLYLLRAFEQKITGKGTGTTFDAITGDQLKEFEIPLASLSEQHKIVEEIERRFSVADEIEKVVDQSLKQSERLRQSILKRAFEGKLVPQWPDLPAPQPGKYWVYVIKCSNDSNYIGQTDNLRKRWEKHLSGDGAEWTKRYPPQYIIYWEEFTSREEAVAKEKWLKTGFGRRWIKREEKAGRLWHAGEPAEKLLERIKAEKEKRNAEDKLKRKRLPRPNWARNDKHN